MTHTWHSQLAAGLHDGKGGVEIVEQSEELSHNGCLTDRGMVTVASALAASFPTTAVSAPCDSVEAAVSLVSGKRQLITICVVPARDAFRRVPK